MMKLIFALLLSLNCLYIATAQTFILNVDQSTLEWTGYAEIGGFSQQGKISAKKGELSLENGILYSSSVIIDMTTITSETENVAKHLKNKDFFYVNRYPDSSLELLAIDDSRITANLTIRGIRNVIEFPITTELLKDGVRIKGTLLIDRTNFEIKYNSSSYFQSLGNQAIKNEFDLEFDLVFGL